MKRFEFITQLAGMAGIGGMIPAALKEAEAKAEAKTKGYTLYEGWVAGYMYHEGLGLEKGLQPGLTLSREPESRYDSRAIEIHACGSKLRYIARDDNKILADMMDQDAPLHAEIAAIRQEEPVWEQLKIRVDLCR